MLRLNMVSACLDGGKSLAGHDSPSARYLVPGLDLKPVFVDCTRILDFCFSQRQLKHAKLVLQKKKKKHQACAFIKYNSASRDVSVTHPEGSLVLPLPVEHKPWTLRRSTPWTLENLWMCLEMSSRDVLWLQPRFGPNAHFLTWEI